MGKEETSLFDLLDELIGERGPNSKEDTEDDDTLTVFDLARIGRLDRLGGKLRQTNVNARNPENGRTVLHEAAANGHLQIVQLTLDFGADVNVQTFLGKDTALHLAVSCEHVRVVLLLLNRGADPNIRNKYLATPLHYSQRRDVASVLLSRGALLNVRNVDNHTPLQAAMSFGDDERRKDLVEFLTAEVEEQSRKEIREEIEANRARKRQLEAIKAEEKEREEAEKARILNKKLMLEYRKWRTPCS